MYDVTIGYKHRGPVFMDIVFGIDPSEVHIHVSRILVKEIPSSADDVASWLIERFRIKDQLLSEFNECGQFPGEGTEGDLATGVHLVTYALVMAFTFLAGYLTIFSSVWFKVYFGLSSCYLTMASIFNIRPSPILGSLRRALSFKSV